MSDDKKPDPVADAKKSVHKVVELEQGMFCEDCGKRSTRLQAVTRRFNRGRCAHCNGKLRPVRE